MGVLINKICKINLFLFYSIFLVLQFVSCGSASLEQTNGKQNFIKKNQWVLTKPEIAGFYTGIGKADDTDVAKRKAKADICNSIKSKIQTDLQTKSHQTVNDDKVNLGEETVNTIKESSTCYFEGMTFKTLKTAVDQNDYYILLGLSKQDYFKSLIKRYVNIEVKGGVDIYNQSGLASYFVEYLKKHQYFPTKNNLDAPNKLKVKLKISYKQIKLGDLSMIAGTLYVSARLLHLKDNKIIKEWNLGRFQAQGFSKQKVNLRLSKKINSMIPKIIN